MHKYLSSLLIAAAICAALFVIFIAAPAVTRQFRRKKMLMNAKTDLDAARVIASMKPPQHDDEPSTQPIAAVITDATAILHDDPYSSPWPQVMTANTAPIDITSIQRPDERSGERPWTDADTDDWIRQMKAKVHDYMAALVGGEEELFEVQEQVVRAGGPKAILGGSWSG